MNCFNISGRIASVPKLRIITIEGLDINVCNFTIGIIDDFSSDEDGLSKYTDLIECICFNKSALLLVSNFEKGDKIVSFGKLKNYFFEDCNRTKHFTHVLLVSQFEFGDSKKSLNLSNGSGSSCDLSVLSDVKDVLKLYSFICEHGYLCIDEDDYYSITMDHFLSR